jgi:tRNA-specific 2-thiouridylase
MKKKALVAMSGGVDSSVAAYLTLKEGYDVIATTILTGSFSCGNDEDSCADGCAVGDARAVAETLGIEHHTLDLSGPFKKHVVDYFIYYYVTGKTPNPCVECNRHIKFGALLDFALERGATKIVTGHYARVGNENGRYLLQRAGDPKKDQSYVLWRLDQRQLSHIYFPLADYRKQEVRELAASLGLPAAKKQESQDICFIPDRDYASFIEKTAGQISPPGDFIDTSGRVLGRHRGLIHYTTGQRKGLGLSLGEPVYVRSKDPEKNTVTLCRESELYTGRLVARQINLIATDMLPGRVRAGAKTRYSQREVPAVVWQTGEDEFVVEFDTPVRAVTPGQSVVLYDGDTVLGGGVIV